MIGLANSRKQTGVALLVALLVVALATLLITALLDDGQLSMARSRNQLRAMQAQAYARGLESYAAQVLVKDNDQGMTDANDDIWGMPLPPTPVPGGSIRATMQDLNGCFNLNNLYQNNKALQKIWKERFGRLLLELQLSPAIARKFADASELRLVAGVDAHAWERLQPYVCALPTQTTLNLNTASIPVLMSLSSDITRPLAARIHQDGRARWNGYEEALQSLGNPSLRIKICPPGPACGLDVKSEYFRARAIVELDGIQFVYTSLLQRQGGVRVLQRSRLSGASSFLLLVQEKQNQRE